MEWFMKSSESQNKRLINNRERSGLSPDMAEGYQEELSSPCPYKVL